MPGIDLRLRGFWAENLRTSRLAGGSRADALFSLVELFRPWSRECERAAFPAGPQRTPRRSGQSFYVSRGGRKPGFRISQLVCRRRTSAATAATSTGPVLSTVISGPMPTGRSYFSIADSGSVPWWTSCLDRALPGVGDLGGARAVHLDHAVAQAAELA